MFPFNTGCWKKCKTFKNAIVWTTIDKKVLINMDPPSNDIIIRLLILFFLENCNVFRLAESKWETQIVDTKLWIYSVCVTRSTLHPSMSNVRSIFINNQQTDTFMHCTVMVLPDSAIFCSKTSQFNELVFLSKHIHV